MDVFGFSMICVVGFRCVVCGDHLSLGPLDRGSPQGRAPSPPDAQCQPTNPRPGSCSPTWPYPAVCPTSSPPRKGKRRRAMVKQGWEYGTVRPRGSRRAKGWAGLEAGVGVDCEVWGCGGRRASHPPACAQSRRRRARSTRHTMGRARAHEREAARTLRSGFGEFGCPPPRTQVPTHTPAVRLLPAHPAVSKRAPDHAAAARGQQGVRRGRATGPCDHLRPKADN